MDRTKEFYKDYYHIKEIKTQQIKKHIASVEARSEADTQKLYEKGLTTPERDAIIELISCNANELKHYEGLLKDCVAELKQEALKITGELFQHKGYNVTLDDISIALNLEDRYIRNTILPHVDYINVPGGGGEFFAQNKELFHWERRYYTWKKTFINRNSLIEYLCKHLQIAWLEQIEPTQEDRNACKTKKDLTHLERYKKRIEHLAVPDATLIQGLLSRYAKVYRKCNIKELVVEAKYNSFINKTANQIKFDAKLKDSIWEEHQLKALQEQTAETLNIKAYDKEIGDYLSYTPHQRIELVQDDSERLTVAYIFLPDIHSNNEEDDNADVQ